MKKARVRGAALALSLSMATVSGQEVLLKVEGDYVGAAMGRAAGIGDVTGDGVRDIAWIEGIVSTAGLRFVSGSDWKEFDAILSRDFEAVRVAQLGDFDGDGFGDILVGQGLDPETPNDDGEARVISGATQEELALFLGPAGQELWFGWRVAAVGDVDQDGFADALMVGRFGGALLGFGPDGSRTRSHPSYGAEVSVAGVGDVNADGHPDYAIGGPVVSIPGGDIHVGVLDIYSGVDGSHIHRLVGGERDDFLGAASAAAGDLNCDGFGDVLVGLPGGPTPQEWSDGGTVRIYSGQDWSVLWERGTSGKFTNYGIGLFGGADFTGDGILDWAVIDAEANGVRGVLELFDGASQSLLWRRHGTDFSSLRSLSVFFPGDMNGDMIADIGYGEITADPNGITAAGILWILAGAPGHVSPFCDANLNSSGRRARIAVDGPVSVGNNELTLEVTGAAPSTFGLFYYGTEPRQFAFGDGFRCVGGNTQRLFPPIVIDDGGRAYRALDFTLPPVAPGGPSPIEAGSTRFFQFWFRDSAAGGTGFNLSDGVEVLFTP